jgi:hypothetical protein
MVIMSTRWSGDGVTPDEEAEALALAAAQKLDAALVDIQWFLRIRFPADPLTAYIALRVALLKMETDAVFGPRRPADLFDLLHRGGFLGFIGAPCGAASCSACGAADA